MIRRVRACRGGSPARQKLPDRRRGGCSEANSDVIEADSSVTKNAVEREVTIDGSS